MVTWYKTLHECKHPILSIYNILILHYDAKDLLKTIMYTINLIIIEQIEVDFIILDTSLKS